MIINNSYEYVPYYGWLWYLMDSYDIMIVMVMDMETIISLYGNLNDYYMDNINGSYELW